MSSAWGLRRLAVCGPRLALCRPVSLAQRPRAAGPLRTPLWFVSRRTFADDGKSEAQRMKEKFLAERAARKAAEEAKKAAEAAAEEAKLQPPPLPAAPELNLSFFGSLSYIFNEFKLAVLHKAKIFYRGVTAFHSAVIQPNLYAMKPPKPRRILFNEYTSAHLNLIGRAGRGFRSDPMALIEAQAAYDAGDMERLRELLPEIDDRIRRRLLFSKPTVEAVDELHELTMAAKEQNEEDYAALFEQCKVREKREFERLRTINPAHAVEWERLYALRKEAEARLHTDYVQAILFRHHWGGGPDTITADGSPFPLHPNTGQPVTPQKEHPYVDSMRAAFKNSIFDAGWRLGLSFGVDLTCAETQAHFDQDQLRLIREQFQTQKLLSQRQSEAAAANAANATEDTPTANAAEETSAAAHQGASPAASAAPPPPPSSPSVATDPATAAATATATATATADPAAAAAPFPAADPPAAAEDSAPPAAPPIEVEHGLAELLGVATDEQMALPLRVRWLAAKRVKERLQWERVKAEVDKMEEVLRVSTPPEYYQKLLPYETRIKIMQLAHEAAAPIALNNLTIQWPQIVYFLQHGEFDMPYPHEPNYVLMMAALEALENGELGKEVGQYRLPALSEDPLELFLTTVSDRRPAGPVPGYPPNAEAKGHRVLEEGQTDSSPVALGHSVLLSYKDALLDSKFSRWFANTTFIPAVIVRQALELVAVFFLKYVWAFIVKFLVFKLKKKIPKTVTLPDAGTKFLRDKRHLALLLEYGYSRRGLKAKLKNLVRTFMKAQFSQNLHKIKEICDGAALQKVLGDWDRRNRKGYLTNPVVTAVRRLRVFQVLPLQWAKGLILRVRCRVYYTKSQFDMFGRPIKRNTKFSQSRKMRMTMVFDPSAGWLFDFKIFDVRAMKSVNNRTRRPHGKS